MASPRASSDPKRPAASPAAPRTYAAGVRISGTVYEVVKILGAGGMGTVYEVEDTSVGKRYVLKTLHPELGDRQDLARRMQNEARTLARLQHPNIVEVVTAGVTTDELKLPFYVMERLEGQNIRVVIEKMRRLSVPHAVRITIDLLDALDRAHESGVVHRDVKPDNIFLHRAPSGSTVTKLLDFGIMRLLDGGRGDTAGRFLGTLRYAAPEQLRGEALSPQTDLYAAGLVLYEMIAGRGPFDDLGSAAAIGRAHIKDAPPPLTRFAPEAPLELSRLVDQALAKDATMRPRDAFTFASELRGLQKMLRPSPPSGSVPSRTLATEVNVLGSIETAVEPRSSVREAAPFSATQRVAAASSMEAPSLAATKLSGPTRHADLLSAPGARGDAAGTDLVDPLDLGHRPTERHDMFGALGNGTEASAPGVSLDNDADVGPAHPQPGPREAEGVKVESLVDRYALTRTSAEEALSIGARRGFAPGPGQLGPGGTEEFVLPPKPLPASAPYAVEVAPYAAAPPSVVVSSTPPRLAPSFAAPPGSSEGRNEPTVRRKPGPRTAWIVVGALVATSAAFGFYRLGTRHAGAAAAAPAPAPTSADVAPVVVALPTSTATASSPAPAASAPPPVIAPAVTASAAPMSPVAPVAPSAAPASKPVVRTPKPAPPPHAVAGPPRVSSGI